MPDPQQQGQQAPATLPPDFFSTQGSQGAPQSLPPDFFDKKPSGQASSAPPPTTVEQPSVKGAKATALQVGSNYLMPMIDSALAPIYSAADVMQGHFGKAIATATGINKLNQVWHSLNSEQQQQFQKAIEQHRSNATGAQVSAAGHLLAGLVPMGGNAAQAGEQIGAHDWGGAAVTMADLLGNLAVAHAMGNMGKGAAATEEVEAAQKKLTAPSIAAPQSDIAKAANRQMDAHSQLVRSNIAKTIENAHAKVGELHNQIKTAVDQKVGPTPISLTSVSDKGLELASKTNPADTNIGMSKANAISNEIERLQGGDTPTVSHISYDEAKGLRTNIGSMMVGTKGAERAILSAQYDNLTSQMQGAATKASVGHLFPQYNATHEMLMNHLHEGVFGDLAQTENGADMVSMLKDAGNTNRFIKSGKANVGLDSMKKDLGPFGLDSKLLNSMENDHPAAYRLAKAGGQGGFQGLVRNITAHPIAATAGAIAGGGASGISGSGMIGRMIGASVAANIADRMALLREAKMALPDANLMPRENAAIPNTPGNIIEKAGGQYMGNKLGLEWFKDPKTGSSTAMPEGTVTPETVQQKLQEVQQKFQQSQQSSATPQGAEASGQEGAIPKEAPVNPQEVADLKAKNPGRVVTPEKVSALNREEAASEVTSGKASLPKETEVADIREPHRAKLEKPDPNRHVKKKQD